MNERFIRYRQKIDFIAEKLSNLPKDFDNELAVDATLYRIQTAIDAVMDIAAMLVKDKNKSVGDDYSNIKALLKAGVINKKDMEELTMINGLRNAIVHKYNSFEEETVINSLSEIVSIIKGFVKVAENEINTIFKKNKG